MELMFNLPAFYACLALEMTGVTHITWVLTYLATLLGGMRKQEEGSQEIEQQEARSWTSKQELELRTDSKKKQIQDSVVYSL